MPLVSKNFADIITFTRATNASYFDSAGVLTNAAAGEARLDYNPSTLAAQGLLIEEARTNSIRNNTMVGAVAGTPGTAPTNWNMTSTGGVITRTIVGTGTENGIAYIDVRYQASAIGNAFVTFEAINFIAATPGQSWNGSAYVKLVGGTYAGITQTDVDITPRDVALTSLADNLTIFTATAAALSTQRISVSHTMPATTAWVTVAIRIIGSGAFDITLRIGLPQLEQGAFATSVIPTTTTALTRAADVASVNTLSPWYNATEGTLYAEFQHFFSSASVFPRVASLDDGTANNATRLGVSGVTAYSYSVFVGGVSQAVLTAGTVANNTTVRSAGAYKVNDFQMAANGLLGTLDTSGTLPTVSQLSLGSAASLNWLNGYLRRITYYPRRLSNAELQTLTT